MARGDGRLFKYPGSEVWWIAYYAGEPAKEVRESSGSRKETDARRLLRTRVGDKESGRPVQKPSRCTFEDLVSLLTDDYQVKGRRTVRRMLQSVAHLRQTFGPHRASAITTDRIVAYHAARLREGAAAGTVRLELSALKRMFRLARRHGRIHTVPDFECPTPNNARQGFFEAADFRRVLERLPEHVRPVALFAYLTGWRRGEIMSLRWSQVDLKAGTVRLEPGTTKNGEGRLFPFSVCPELDELMRAQWDATVALHSASGWVFHRRGKPLRNFYTAWRAACRDAGVPMRLFHDLRRTAVRNLERAGVPRSWAKQLTGHRTDSVYMRYAIVSEQDLRDAVSRLTASQAEEAVLRKESRRT